MQIICFNENDLLLDKIISLYLLMNTGILFTPYVLLCFKFLLHKIKKDIVFLYLLYLLSINYIFLTTLL